MPLQMIRIFLILVILSVVRHAVASDQPAPPKKTDHWRALHLIVFKTDDDLKVLESQIPKLAQMGVNVLVLEINYNFAIA